MLLPCMDQHQIYFSIYHLYKLVHVHVCHNCVSINTLYELPVINNVTRTTNIHFTYWHMTLKRYSCHFAFYCIVYVMPLPSASITPMASSTTHDTDARIGTSTGTKSHIIPLNNHPNMTNAMMSLMTPL